ncbi:hypothetical protein ACFWBR_27605 [Streptomyces sp. NPDC060006]|uniref:hypothetical protein n=1 Tax=unclassified Streptomyces TaxID=2593676 RepID=UPI0036991954
MPADNVARAIAGASALVTALNMFISFKTYRGVRPHVVVRVSRGAELSGRPLSVDWLQNAFRVHLDSKSQSTVKLIRMELQGSTYRTLEWIWRASPYSRLYMNDVDVLKGAEETDIKPFGDIRWVIREKPPRRLSLGDIRRIRVVVTLDNGNRRKSNWISMRSMDREDKDLHLRLIRHRRVRPFEQLSFDDLNGEG